MRVNDNVLIRNAARFAVTALTIFIIAATLVFHQLQIESETSRNWVLHTYEVSGHIQLLFNRLKDVELGQRGFMIAGEEAYLEPYHEALTDSLGADKRSDRLDQHHSLAEEMTILRRLTEDSAQQQQNLDQMGRYIQQLLRGWELTIHTRQNGQDNPAPKLDFHSEDQLMNHVRSLVSIMLAQENQLLAKRTETARASASHNNMLIFFGIGLFYLVMVLAIGLGSRLAKDKLIAQNALFSQKALLESLIEALPIPLFAKNAADRFQYVLWNAKAEEQFEKPRGRVLGTTDREHFSEERASAINAVDRQVMEASHVLDIPKEIIETASGRWLSHTRKVPIYDAQGKPSLLLGLFEDITQRDAMDRMKSEFVSTVSHELRTPLTSIRGSLGLILGGIGGDLPEKSRGLIDIAYKNCERLILLINDILDVEKLESGQMHFEMQWVDVKPLLEQAVELNKPYAEKYGVTLSLPGFVPSTKVNVDSARFMQVMSNLISNAAKFSHVGGKVTIWVQTLENTLKIFIKDNGIGIAREFHTRIFGKFAQADGSETKAKGGTGLGLSITKSMIERMGGTIGFESEENTGTTFHVTLPVVTAQISAFPNRSKTDSANRLLVCEDDADVASILKRILEGQGFAVDVAFNARQAHDLLRANAYLLMTLDLRLPDKNGVEFIRELRAAPETALLPIIVVSAQAEEGRLALNGNAVGILDWLVKPIDNERLITAVRSVSRPGAKPWLLHVEDDPDIAHIIAMGLQDVAHILQAATVEEAENLLRTDRVDLVLLDLALPGRSGLDLLKSLNRKGARPIPVIIFSASEVPPEINQQVAAALVKAKTSEEEIISTILSHMQSKPTS